MSTHSSYWTVRVRIRTPVTNLELAASDDECYVTAHLRIGTARRAARLDSQALAAAFAEACAPVFNRRYGINNWETSLLEVISTHPRIDQQIANDSAMVRERLQMHDPAARKALCPKPHPTRENP